MALKRGKELPKYMNKEEFLNYVHENFTISVEAQYLIRNILDFAETLPKKHQKPVLQKLLGFTIGLTSREINTINFDKDKDTNLE